LPLFRGRQRGKRSHGNYGLDQSDSCTKLSGSRPHLSFRGLFFFNFRLRPGNRPRKFIEFFLAFFYKYSKNSPRKSKGSRNVIRAELRRLPIPTRNARPNLVAGTGGSGSQPPNCVWEIVHFAPNVRCCHKPVNSAPRRIFSHSDISDIPPLANRVDRVRISSGTAGLGAPTLDL